MGRIAMNEEVTRMYFKQLLLALEYLHQNLIVHHDLKPQNILLNHENKIKICDFGAARAYSNHEIGLPFTGIFGTPGYIGNNWIQYFKYVVISNAACCFLKHLNF